MNKTFVILTVAILLAGVVSALYHDTEIDTDADVNTQVDSDVNVDGSMDADLDSEIGLDSEMNFGSSASIEADEREIVADLDGAIDPSSIIAVSDLRISSGFGWAIRDSAAVTEEEGDFARVILVERVYMSGTNERFVLTRGLVKIHSKSTFEIARDSREALGNNGFVVRQNGAVVGTFTIDEERRMDSFVVWTGRLNLDSGESYDLEFATRERNIRVTPQQNIRVDASLNGDFETRRNTSGSFMTRLRAIFV